MSQAGTAADYIRVFLARSQLLVETANVLDEIGSLEGAEQNARRRKEDAVNAKVEAETTLSGVQARLNEAESRIQGAINKGTQIVSEAEEKARGIINDGTSRAQKDKEGAAHRKSEITKEINALQAVKDELTAQVSELRNERTAIRDSITQTKLKIAELSGGG